jgi:hypothetical protein
MNRFFTDHLAFEILRYFPTVDTDNHFKNIGLHGVFDSKFERIIITKLDYIPQPTKEVFYDEVAKEFYVDQPVAGDLVVKKYVQTTDLEYFCNKSWTASFNLNTKSWVSFHTYLPNFYVGENNFFYSGLNEGCDVTAVAVVEIPSPTTTTTTTRIIYCNLTGTAVVVGYPCLLGGTASEQTTTTTTSTSTSTTTTTTTTVPFDCRLIPGSFTTEPDCRLTAGEFIRVPVTTTTTATVPPTTTTTTTPQPALYRYSSAGPDDACGTALAMTNVILTDPPFCSATAIQCDEFVLAPAGVDVWVRTGNSYRAAVINDPNTSGIATFAVGTCIVCTTTTSTSSSTTTTTTTAAPVTRNVTNISGSASNILGEIYIDASVTLDGNVSTDTIVEVVVSSIPYGNTSVFVTIPNGSSSGFGSTSVGMGSLPLSISGQCIAGCDNVNVVLTGFTC